MDLNRCINCRACEVACEREHAGASNMYVQLIDERYALPLNCRHCEDSFCTAVCPTQAVHRASEDAVIVNPMKCIGCGLCTLACPFGAVWLDTANKIARKCDLCAHRTVQGLEPACVTTCSARALYFGEFNAMAAKALQNQAGVAGIWYAPDNLNMSSALRVLACVGMVGWGILATVEPDLKRLLFLSATSQFGFVLLALALPENPAVTYLLTSGIGLLVLFVIVMLISRAFKTSNIDQMGGLAARMPLVFLLFLLAALWLSGLPPFGNFFSKYLLGVAAGAISPVLTLIITGTALLTLAYLLRPIRRFLRPA